MAAEVGRGAVGEPRKRASRVQRTVQVPMHFLRGRKPKPPEMLLYPIPLRPGVYGMASHRMKCQHVVGERDDEMRQCRFYAVGTLRGHPRCRKHGGSLLNGASPVERATQLLIALSMAG